MDEACNVSSVVEPSSVLKVSRGREGGARTTRWARDGSVELGRYAAGASVGGPPLPATIANPAL